MSVPKYDGPASDNFDGQTFQNLEPNPDKSIFTVLKWLATKNTKDWPTDVNVKTSVPDKSVEGHNVHMTWVNHSTVLIQTEGVNILTDPVWSERVGPYSWMGPKRHHAPGIQFEDLPMIDASVVSHNHYDHMDLPTLERLQANGRSTVFAGLGNKKFLNKNGIQVVHEMDWWNSHNLTSKVKIHFVPAQHWSYRGLGGRRTTLWGGFVIETSHHKIFYAGDTGWGKHFSQIKEKLGPMDICLLPIGAYLPRDFMKSNHLNPEDSVLTHIELGCKNTLGVHYMTFKQSDEDWDQPPKDLEDAKLKHLPNSSFRTIHPGERWTL